MSVGGKGYQRPVIDRAYMSQGKGFSDSTSEYFVPIDTVSTANP